MGVYRVRSKRQRDAEWDADLVRLLRRHLQLTQREFAEELNARQQTVSEWETGRYRPRGPSARLLTLIAEEAGFRYQAGPPATRLPPTAPVEPAESRAKRRSRDAGGA